MRVIFGIILSSLMWTVVVGGGMLDVGQLFVVGFYGQHPYESSVKRLKMHIDRGDIGGVIVFNNNIKSPDQLRELIGYLKKDAPYPLIVAIDQEGGAVERLGHKQGFVGLKSAKEIADQDSFREAYILYYEQAQQLFDLGITLNLGAVADLITVTGSPGIGDNNRSFSGDPGIVSGYIQVMANAHRDAGVQLAIKHFPGQGSASEDTHFGFTDSTLYWTEDELTPYKSLILSNSVDVIMTSHVINRRFDTTLPCSLSKPHLSLLRDTLGYNGLVITDDLNMGAIKMNFSLDETVTHSISSGNDILLFGNGGSTFIRSLHRAIQRGLASNTISQQTLQAAIDRIIRYKTKAPEKKLFYDYLTHQ